MKNRKMILAQVYVVFQLRFGFTKLLLHLLLQCDRNALLPMCNEVFAEYYASETLLANIKLNYVTPDFRLVSSTNQSKYLIP